LPSRSPRGPVAPGDLPGDLVRSLASLAAGVASGLDLEHSFSKVAAGLSARVGADRLILLTGASPTELKVACVNPPRPGPGSRAVPAGSLPARVLAEGRAIFSSANGRSAGPRMASEGGCRSRIAVPVPCRDRVEGVLLAGRRRARGFTLVEVDLLTSCAEFIGVILDNTRLALVDGVTGVYNHRHFQVLLGLEIERARRFGKEFTLLMADVDDFKRINDRHGHLAGDRVLRRAADSISAAVRRLDIVARYGGEEFAVILPGTPVARGRAVAEKIRRSAAAGTASPPDGGEAIGVTLSLGVAGFPGHGGDRESLIAAADAALYRAKAEGKNRVRLALASRARPQRSGPKSAGGQ
jgi:diguanylate cyclase (GGDEF)-like protein